MIDPNELVKIINKRTQVPESLRHNRDELNQYISHFQDKETGKINFKNFIDDLKQFDYQKSMNEAEGVEPRSGYTVRSGVTESDYNYQPKSIFNDDYIVLD